MGSADLLLEILLGLAGEVRDPKPNALIPRLGGRGYTKAFGKTCPPPLSERINRILPKRFRRVVVTLVPAKYAQ